VASLPRGTRITGTIAIRRRSRALAEVYVLAADAGQARQGFEEAYARPFAQ
jgi:hypothetical protein